MAAGGSGTYQVDELITQASTGANGRVIEWDATNSILYYHQEKDNVRELCLIKVS